MRITWQVPLILLLCTSYGRAHAGPSEPSSTKSKNSNKVRIHQDVDWNTVNKVVMLPTRFELDKRFHRRRYEARSRRTLDNTLSTADRKTLADAMASTLGRTMHAQSVPDTKAAVQAGTLVLEPIVLSARWTRPPTRAYTTTNKLDARSKQAGGAAVRIKAYIVEEGQLVSVATFEDRWRARLGDGLIRAEIWADAKQAFQIISRRLQKQLKARGLNHQ